MQKVKYTNPKGQSVEIGCTQPFIFESITGVDSVGTQIVTSEFPGQHGKSSQQVTLSDREITVAFHVQGDGRADMYEERRMICAVSSSLVFVDGEPSGKLEYENESGKWWIPCLVKAGAKFDSRKGNYNHSKIIFYCPEPFWRGYDTEIDYLAYLGGGLEFPLEIDAENCVEFGARGYRNTMYNFGDSPAPVQISITGPATEPTIIKTGTGELIRLKKPLAAGDTLTIDTEGQRFDIKILKPSGKVESPYGYLDLSSTPFALDPGANELEYQSGDDTETARVVVTCKPYFGGV